MSKNTSKKKQKAAVMKNSAAKADATRQAAKASAAKNSAATKKNATAVEVVLLSEIVEQLSAERASAARAAYVGSARHLNFVLSGEFTAACRERLAALRKGNVAPHLAICCCEDTFASILSECPYATYEVCQLPVEIRDEDEDCEEVPLDEALSVSAARKLSALPADERGTALVKEHSCETYTYRQRHKEDEASQAAYRAAVLAYLRAGAAYAQKIGSASVRQWLEAERLLLPEQENASDGALCVVSAANARQAYATAQRAQADLWIDLSIRKMRKR